MEGYYYINSNFSFYLTLFAVLTLTALLMIIINNISSDRQRTKENNIILSEIEKLKEKLNKN